MPDRAPGRRAQGPPDRRARRPRMIVRRGRPGRRRRSRDRHQPRATTLAMCLRRLPFDEALAIADSALRHGDSPSPGCARWPRLRGARLGAGATRRPRSRRAVGQPVRVGAARHLPPGPRARRRTPGTHLAASSGWASVRTWSTATPRIVIEADSFEWHGDRAGSCSGRPALHLLVADGWTVLRFTWEDVMHDPDWVRAVLRRPSYGPNERSPRGHAALTARQRERSVRAPTAVGDCPGRGRVYRGSTRRRHEPAEPRARAARRAGADPRDRALGTAGRAEPDLERGDRADHLTADVHLGDAAVPRPGRAGAVVLPHLPLLGAAAALLGAAHVVGSVGWRAWRFAARSRGGTPEAVRISRGRAPGRAGACRASRPTGP